MPRQQLPRGLRWELHGPGPKALNMDCKKSAGRSLHNNSQRTWYQAAWQPSWIPHAAPSSFKLLPDQCSLNPLHPLLLFLTFNSEQKASPRSGKDQKTPIVHVPVSAMLGAAENAQSAPVGSNGGSSGSQARAGTGEAAPCQTPAKAPGHQVHAGSY